MHTYEGPCWWVACYGFRTLVHGSKYGFQRMSVVWKIKGRQLRVWKPTASGGEQVAVCSSPCKAVIFTISVIFTGA